MAESDNRTRTGKILIWLVVIVVIIVVVSRIANLSRAAARQTRTGTTTTSPTTAMRERRAKTALKYLDDIEEIKWVQFEDNNAYIGFDPLPNDWQAIIRAAALHANKATDFGFHVWAVKAEARGWRPGSSRSLYGEVTARHGKIE